MESRDGLRPKSKDKSMSDPMLLELKMADCFKETAGIFVAKDVNVEIPSPVTNCPPTEEANRPRATSYQANSIIS